MTATKPTSLRALVARSDGHPALVVPESGASLSYAALQRALDRAAGRQAALGVREGDRVALVAANGPALIMAFLAVVASGAAAAPLNPALGAAELTPNSTTCACPVCCTTARPRPSRRRRQSKSPPA